MNKRNYKHGEEGTRLYVIWQHVKQRILNPNSKDYPNYGGRGITICDEWLEFIPFRDWALSNGYADNLVIDRKDNDGNYEPINCHFSTLEKSCQNRRNNKLDFKKAHEIRELYKTKKYTQYQLAEKYNVNRLAILEVINNKSWKVNKED